MSAALLLAERALLALASLASLGGCALILATWKRVAGPNYLSRRLITSLGLSGLLSALAFSLSTLVDGLGAAFARHEALCYLQALSLQFFYLASYLWTGCFAFHLFQIIVRRNEYPEKLLWVYRCVAWGIPGLEVAFLVLRQLTGHIGVGPADRRWCWIAVHTTTPGSEGLDEQWSREGALQQLLLFYLPISLVFVFNAVVYFQILRYLAADPMAAKFRNKVVLYLSIFFLCSIWGAINRGVQFQRADHSANAFLTLMECVCDPLQPLLNAVAYGINKRALDAYRDRICCASNPTSTSHTLSWWNAWMHTSLPSSGDEDEDEDMLPLMGDDAENPASHDEFSPSSRLLENDQLAPIILSPPQSSRNSSQHDHLDLEFAQYFSTPKRSSGRSKRASRR